MITVELHPDAGPIALRLLLEPLWTETHQGWDDPVPNPISRGMCRYTAELVAMIDPTWTVVLGLVDGDETHTWNEAADGRFRDITGDQFSRPRVQCLDARPAGYVVHPWTDPSTAGPYRARATKWGRRIGQHLADALRPVQPPDGGGPAR